MIYLDLDSYSTFFSGYTELRLQRNQSTRISFIKGNNVGNEKSQSSGVSARVYKNGSWGFSSSPELTDDSIKTVIKAATDNAIFLDSRENKAKGGLPGCTASSNNDLGTKKKRLSQKELMDFVKKADEYVANKYPGLESRTVVLNCLDMEKRVLTSEGSSFYSMTPRSILYVIMATEKDGRPVELYNVYGGLGQFEDVFDDISVLYEGFDRQYEDLMKKREGVYPEAGLKTCILDAELSGILAHEAIGHTTEADLVMSGSVAANYLGKEVASPLVTLVDFANTAMGVTCPVPVYVDDEGTKANDAVIIEKGILKGFMHNKESAAHFGTEPTGNARAYRFSDEPLIRMRNTAILPGTSKLEDMIKSIDDGYYLIRTGNGQADSTSEFMFSVSLGYEIKNGKLGRALRDTTISGVAFDVLKTVSMVSDEMNWSCAGMCGKKQPIPVGMGGPAIKCQVNVGGR